MTFMKNKTIKIVKYYRSKDIAIITTLFSLGEKIDSIEKINGECWFLMENEPKCLELERKYYSGELKIDPRNLFDSFKAIKSMIFSR